MKTIIIVVLGLLLIKLGWKVAKMVVKAIASLALAGALVFGLLSNVKKDPDVIAWKNSEYPGMSDTQVFNAVKDSTLMVVKGVSDIVLNVLSSQVDSAYVDIKTAITE